MMSEVIVGIISFLGTCIGALYGVIRASQLVNYRIGELEKRVDKHNTIIERVSLLELSNKLQQKTLDTLRAEVEKIKEEVYGEN